MSRKQKRVAALVEQHHGHALDQHYVGFFDCFNRQLFYEAHEVLEHIWLPDKHGPNEAFYKSLIQLADAFVHLQKKSPAPSGGAAGSGRQYISWIHLADMDRMFIEAIEREELAGTFNATAPNPVTNAEFMSGLRHALHRPWSPSAPEWAVRFGSRLMKTEPSLALTGRHCAPKRFLEGGFKFQFTELRAALKDIYP